MKDAHLMDAEKMAREAEEMGANTITMNAGGIVAWYPSRVKYHMLMNIWRMEGIF
jgi:methylmalonyl-CoA mutase cobalamin-binding subunit